MMLIIKYYRNYKNITVVILYRSTHHLCSIINILIGLLALSISFHPSVLYVSRMNSSHFQTSLHTSACISCIWSLFVYSSLSSLPTFSSSSSLLLLLLFLLPPSLRRNLNRIKSTDSRWITC